MKHSLARSPLLLSALCWPLAVLAYAGAVGLILGAVDLSVSAVDRIPASNTAVAGIALAIVVGLPMTIAAVRTQHSRKNGAPGADDHHS
jgi:hypothetical protein